MSSFAVKYAAIMLEPRIESMYLFQQIPGKGSPLTPDRFIEVPNVNDLSVVGMRETMGKVSVRLWPPCGSPHLNLAMGFRGLLRSHFAQREHDDSAKPRFSGVAVESWDRLGRRMGVEQRLLIVQTNEGRNGSGELSVPLCQDVERVRVYVPEGVWPIRMLLNGEGGEGLKALEDSLMAGSASEVSLWGDFVEYWRDKVDNVAEIRAVVDGVLRGAKKRP